MPVFNRRDVCPESVGVVGVVRGHHGSFGTGQIDEFIQKRIV